MEKNSVSVKQIGTPLTFDPLEKCIIDLVNAMRSDFGNRFKSQFSDENDALRLYKRRLYAKLRGRAVEFIYAAYDAYIDAAPEWPPTVPELIACVDKAEKLAKKAKESDIEVQRIAALPAPSITCDTLALLAAAKSNKAPPATHEEWLRRKADALKNNEAVLMIHQNKIRRHYAQTWHNCKVPSCLEIGTISGGTKGGDAFYCQNHFFAAN